MDKTSAIAIFIAAEYSTKKAIELLYPSVAEGDPLTTQEKNELLMETEQEDRHFIIKSINWQEVDHMINQRLHEDSLRFKG